MGRIIERSYFLVGEPGNDLGKSLAAALKVDVQSVNAALKSASQKSEVSLRDGDIREEWRIALAVIGVFAVVASLWLVSDTKDTTAATLLAAGFLLLLLGAFANRVKSFKGAGLEVVLSDLQEKAKELQETSLELKDLAKGFEAIHALPESTERSLMLKGLAATTAQAAGSYSAPDVAQLARGDVSDRLRATIVMGCVPELAKLEWLKDVVDAPRTSNFEVFQALNSIHKVVLSAHTPVGQERDELLRWVEAKRFPSSTPGETTSREQTAREIERALVGRPG